MASFVLVHGMFHGDWCWDRLRSRLEALGHEVITPNLAGCGDDKTPHDAVTLDDWASAVAGDIVSAAEPVVLVGHSRGGLVISEASERVPDKVAVNVYLTALMLPAGKGAADTGEIFEQHGSADDGPNVLAAPGLSEDALSLLPPEDSADLFYRDCSAEDREWALERLGGEPLLPAMSPVSITAGAWGSIPSVYIETTKDRVLSLAMQRAMVRRMQPDEVITMETDHMPILTDVAELTEILDDIASRYAGATLHRKDAPNAI